MEDTLQSGLQQDQWFSSRATSEKLLEKRTNSLGSGALHFIRTRSSIRRELKRHCNQSKSSGSTSGNNEGGNGGGGVGGLGKWLREHLGGGSRGSHDVSIPLPAKRTGSADKNLTRVTYASQNLYCSLPREHGRHCHNVRKHIQPGLHSRPRSNSANFHEKSHDDSAHTPFIGTITRGGPIYGSEGKTIKRRNRDRRRHSLNETQDSSQNHRKRVITLFYWIIFSLDFVPLINTMQTESEDIKIGDDKDSSVAGALEDIAENSVEMPFEMEHLVMDETNEEEYESIKKWLRIKMPSIAEEDDNRYKSDEKIKDENEAMETVYTELEKTEESAEKEGQYEEQQEEDEESVSSEEEEYEEEYVIPQVSKTKKAADMGSLFFYDDISLKDFQDRRSMIDKLKKLVSEQIELRRKNRLLEYWVVKNSAKMNTYITTVEEDRKQKVLDNHYKIVLEDYKNELERNLSKKKELTAEMSTYNDKYIEYLDKDYDVSLGLMNLERSTGSGLIFAKTGRQLTERAVQTLIHRQRNRCERLYTVRLKYITKQHQYQEIQSRIDQIETLGPGMSTMDYEQLCLQQVAFKEKVDEREHELEKIRNSIQQLANSLAHCGEKSSFLDWDIKNLKIDLKNLNAESYVTRESVSDIRCLLANVRRQYSKKRYEAGFLVAQSVLLEMERTLRILDELRGDIETIKSSIDHLQATARNKSRNEKSMMTPVPKYKRSSNPGRC